MANTIQAVQNNGTYEGSYGTMYKQEVTLDDGSMGEVSAKTADKWKVGDVVEVQRTETKFGTRFKFSIPQEAGGQQGGARSNGFSGSSFKQDPETQFRIEASWAIGQAVAMGAQEHAEIVKAGLALIDARNALIQALKDAKQ